MTVVYPTIVETTLVLTSHWNATEISTATLSLMRKAVKIHHQKKVCFVKTFIVTMYEEHF